jgi:hypothetical protein
MDSFGFSTQLQSIESNSAISGTVEMQWNIECIHYLERQGPGSLRAADKHLAYRRYQEVEPCCISSRGHLPSSAAGVCCLNGVCTVPWEQISNTLERYRSRQLRTLLLSSCIEHQARLLFLCMSGARKVRGLNA